MIPFQVSIFWEQRVKGPICYFMVTLVLYIQLPLVLLEIFCCLPHQIPPVSYLCNVNYLLIILVFLVCDIWCSYCLSAVRLWSTNLNANLVCYKGHNYPVWDVQVRTINLLLLFWLLLLYSLLLLVCVHILVKKKVDFVILKIFVQFYIYYLKILLLCHFQLHLFWQTT